MNLEEVRALRACIEQRLGTGETPTHIAAALGCSRNTIYTVQQRILEGTTLSDKRQYNPGRPKLHGEVITEAILAARRDYPFSGPLMLYHLIARDPARYGLRLADLPSSTTIGRLIHHHGLARKPIGPHDQRLYPDMPQQEAGAITIDTWGPWHIRADRLYLATVQDRHTRLSAAMPATGKQLYSSDASAVPGLSTRTWAQALLLAHRFITPGVQRVYTDNGVGIVPSQGSLPLAARYALSLGATLVYIPPAQPWRNGKLERWHWTMETEFWRAERPSSLPEALAGLTAWLNYYNHDRPHSTAGFKAPAEAHRWPIQLPEGYWRDLDVPKALEPQRGTIEVLRLVDNRGEVDTWGYRLALTPLLAGQFVRLVFAVTGGVAAGRVLYQQRKGMDIEVATFTHTLDAIGEPGRQQALYRDVHLVQFDADVPKNQRLDEEQWANQQSRTQKQRSRAEQRLAEAALADD